MSDQSPKFYAFGPFRIDTRRRRLLREDMHVPLTPKAFDILLLLVEHGGEVLEKDQLLKQVWPEQFVEEANLTVNMSALRKALGERAGASQYILTVPRRGYRFVAEVQEIRDSAVNQATAHETTATAESEDKVKLPAPETIEAQQTSASQGPGGNPNNLPIQLTPFIGRELESASVEKLLRRDDVRLLTLTGPGGSGKTRLALQIASVLLDEFADGRFFVALEPINDPHLVISTISQTLGVKESGGTTLIESLKNFLRDKRVLLILDNFEHIVSAAPLLASLLTATLHLKILVTSRAVLRLSGEHEFQVPPLLLPDLRGLPRAPELLNYASIELFVQRAMAAKSDFLLTEKNARAVAKICVHLDGLPLAIELAAARVRLLPPQAMLTRLGTPFKLLTGGARNLPARQQTMSGAIAWSYDLLDEAGQCLFRRLSVFVGGATLQAAEAVCRETSGEDGEIHDGVAALVDNSLLRQVEQPGGEPRFVMLETIREYGLELLRSRNELDAARRRHANFYLELAEEADSELGGEHLNFWLEQLEQEHDNLRAALGWSLESGDGEIGLRLVKSLWWFWYLHGHYFEGREWINRVIAKSSVETSIYRAGALLGAGVLAFLQCEYSSADELLNESLELSRRASDRKSTAMALQVLGSVARERGDYGHAIARHQESQILWDELGDKRGRARSFNYIGFAAWLDGNFEKTAACCKVALPLFRELGDKEGIIWSLLNLAAISHYKEEYERAAVLGGESLALSREMGYKEGIAWSLNILGNVLYCLKSYERAAAMLQESLHLQHELGDRWRMASVLESLGGLFNTLMQAEKAAWLFAAAESLRETVGTPLPPVEREHHYHHLKILRDTLDEKVLNSLWAEGRTMPLEQIIACALEPTEAQEEAGRRLTNR